MLISECFALPLPRDRTAEAIGRSPEVEGEAFGSTHAGFCRSVIAQMLLPYMRSAERSAIAPHTSREIIYSDLSLSDLSPAY